MSKPRIFISHSAKDDQACNALAALLARLEVEGFEALLDKERLKAGDAWRRQLHLWLLQCDAGIILFSEHALASDWVFYESMVLTSRTYLEPPTNDEPAFLVLPMLLPPVTPERLAESRFEPMNLGEIQATPPESIAAAIDQIVERIRPLKIRMRQSPFEKLERHMRPWLSPVDPQIQRQAAQALQISDDEWTMSRGDTSLLVQGLLRADPRTVLSAMQILTPQLTAERARQLISIVFAFWVNAEATAQIAVVATGPAGRRTVAANAYNKETARMYVQCACRMFPPWDLIIVTNRSGGDQVGWIMRELKAEYKARLGPDVDQLEDNDIEYDLSQFGIDAPFFVVVPGYLDVDELERLRGKYPNLTIFLLTGDLALDQEQMRAVHIAFLQPKLERAEEQEALRLYREARLLIQRSYPG